MRRKRNVKNKIRIDLIVERLHERYGSPDHNNKEDGVDELVFILLANMTRHQAFNRAYDQLKERFGDWDELLTAPLAEIRRCIETAGLENRRAKMLVSVLTKIKSDHGTISLKSLKSRDDAEAIRYLCSLPGVGEKTARCVLMYAYNRHVLPVDTHTHRISERLGLVPKGTKRTKIHLELESAIPPGHRYSFHTNAVSLGRELCLTNNPKCDRCPLSKLCISSDYNSGA